jgi:LPS-assembly protein
MRLYHKPLVILLLCYVAHQAYADEEPPEQRTVQTSPSSANTSVNQEAPAVIDADSLVGQKNDQIDATGNATIRQDGKSIRADQLLYMQGTHDVKAKGSVVLKQDNSTVSGTELQFNLDSKSGTVDKPKFYLDDVRVRGTGETLRILDQKHFSIDRATYTTCPAGNDDWYLRVGELDIDRERQIGVARDASIDFKNVPILYSPWMDFSLNDQRKSGFLSPIFGGTVTGGSELTLPYYLNLAPNFDATVAPRYMVKRGLMLNDELRYLGGSYSGELHIDMLPNDHVAERNRGRFALVHNQAFGSSLNGYLNFTRVGDDAYFRDLGDSINSTSQVNLLQEAGLRYMAAGWVSTLRVQNFQTLQDPAAPIIVPYTRMPQLTVSTNQNYAGANLAFGGEYVNFTHPTEVNGSRIVINPSISYPMASDSSFYITPKVGLHDTYYNIGANNVAGLANATRVLPIVSVDSGVAFERESSMFSGNYVQTLEPRAYYVYIPYRDQSSLPNFDSALADFNFTQIFTENRFSGSDRIGDADQITLAATSRFLDQNTGAERLRVMLGERFSLITPQVNLVAPTTTYGRSDILLTVSGQRTRAWSLLGELQFDPNQSHVQLFNVESHYHPEAGKALNLGYRLQRDTLRQLDLSAQWPVFRNWNMVGRWNYSVPDSRILDAIAGIEYNQSCWTLRLVAQRFATSTQETNTGFFVQLDLNGFARVGSDPLSMLKQSIPGYTILNSTTPGVSAQPLQ